MQTHYDIAICGAGPTGQALALLLLKHGPKDRRIVLIDARSEQDVSNDQRSIALSYGSQQILQMAGAWPIRCSAIQQIHVSRKGHFGRTLIDSAEQKVPAMGYVARYSDILAPLTEALHQHSDQITFLRPVRVCAITETESTSSHAVVTLEDQQVLTADIVVQAEGGLFGDQAAAAIHNDYGQNALVGTVQVSEPIPGRAFERFTDEGPLALLPKADGYGLVWCVKPDRAAALTVMTKAQFLAALQQEFGSRLGKFLQCSPLTSYPLGLNVHTAESNGRAVRIGNAAQTLHPVAGQGLNLGLRDAMQLAKCLAKSMDVTALQEFIGLRLADRRMTVRLTDQMAQIFTVPPAGLGKSSQSGVPLPQSLLSAGLGLIDLITPAKKWLAGQMMYGSR